MATLSVGTCNEACWGAQEDQCHCMCGGRNHGIYRHGGKQPGRFCRRKFYAYKLVSITPNWLEARDASFSLTWPGGYAAGDCHPNRAFEQQATGQMLKWPEVRTFLASHGEAYLVWHRINDDGELDG